jgi:hypothetical protein
MLLFDAGIRTELGWKKESESTFAYYNRSARPSVVAFRKVIEDWFNRYHDEDKKNLRERFRSPKEPNHPCAFFEIYLHELFSCLGFELEPHPTIRGCGTHPDYVVSNRGANQFYLEATLAGLPSQQEQGANARTGIVYDAINTIESPNFFLELEIRGAPNTPPPTQRLRRDLTGWLASLDADHILQLHRAGRDSEIPFFPWQHEGWSLLFRPIPKSSKLRGQPGVRPIGMRMPEGGWMNTHGEIRKAIENKAKKYGELELPFIIAVNVVADHCDNIDIMNALYGDESILFTQTAEGGFTERNERKQNGTWIGPQGPRNLLVSGALIFAGLGPWSMGVVTPELFHNPWAQRPFPISSWPLPYCVVDLAADRARREHGKTARELLDLPAQWPVPDTNAGE